MFMFMSFQPASVCSSLPFCYSHEFLNVSVIFMLVVEYGLNVFTKSSQISVFSDSHMSYVWSINRKTQNTNLFPPVILLPQLMEEHLSRLAKKQCSLDIRKFSQRTVNEWNRLSADCVGASSVNIFKNKIDIYLRRAGYT